MRGAWIEIAPAHNPADVHQSLPVRGAWIEICGNRPADKRCKSLPVRGAWIEIASCCWVSPFESRRSPCGERGLKSHTYRDLSGCQCRSPCGERGLKWLLEESYQRENRRSPCGERGLKSPAASLPRLRAGSLPVRGAWIEICFYLSQFFRPFRRSPCGERGLKSLKHIEAIISAGRSPCGERGLKSVALQERYQYQVVAPRAGSVD